MNGLALSMMLHLGHTCFSFWQNRTFSLHNLISAWFSIIVCLGYFIVDTGIYQAVYGISLRFPYEPYILEFLFYLVFMWPFRNYSTKDIQITEIPHFNKKIQTILKLLLVAYGVYFVLLLKVALYVYSQGIGEAYDAAHYEGASLYPYSNFELKIIWICGSLYDWTSPVIMLYALYGIITNKNGWSRRYNSFCLLLIIFMFFLSCVSTGQRGGTFFFMVRLLFVFVPFWTQFPKKVKAVIMSYLPWVVLLFFLYAVSMTLYRTEGSTSETPLTQVLRYLGEPYPHLGNVFWNKVLVYPMGARLFPFVIEPSTIVASAKSMGEQHVIWQSITGVPILNYKTLYGDFYVDFGPYIPFAFIFVYSLILKFFTSSGKVKFAAYPVLYYYIVWASTAPLWFSMRDWIGIKNLLAAIMLYYIIKVIIKK